MLNHELITAIGSFSEVAAQHSVTVVNPAVDGSDHAKYNVGTVTFLSGTMPADTIIETTRELATLTVAQFIDGLTSEHPDGTAQVFVRDWEGQLYAYFDIDRVRRSGTEYQLILGDWRCGGS
jgi:hypothetical protein